MLDHSFSQFFLPQPFPPPKTLARFMCMHAEFAPLPGISTFPGTTSSSPKHANIDDLPFPFPFPFCCFPSFAHLSFFLIQIGHFALKWYVFQNSKQAALFSALLHPDLLLSKSPFNCNPSILANRACFSSKVFFLSPIFRRFPEFSENRFAP